MVTPRFMLDTNICINIMSRTPEQVAQRMDQCRPGEVVMSSITYAELTVGILMARDSAQARKQLDLLVEPRRWSPSIDWLQLPTGRSAWPRKSAKKI